MEDDTETKVCTKCVLELSVDSFYWKDAAHSRRCSRCKDCHNKKSTEWREGNRDRAAAAERARRATHPEQYALYDLRKSARKIGLDPDVIENHYRDHNGLCDVCGEPPGNRGPEGNRRLCIDHDHATGVFRGLLCHGCNLALGNMDDKPKWLLAAAYYLEARGAVR